MHRLPNDGNGVADVQTLGAPRRTFVKDELRSHPADKSASGIPPMREATHHLGIARHTVLYREGAVHCEQRMRFVAVVTD